jgi:hypothetical protein
MRWEEAWRDPLPAVCQVEAISPRLWAIQGAGLIAPRRKHTEGRDDRQASWAMGAAGPVTFWPALEALAHTLGYDVPGIGMDRRRTHPDTQLIVPGHGVVDLTELKDVG